MMASETNMTEAPRVDEETKIIAAQNDQFRQSACRIPAMPSPIEGRLVLTQGIDAEGPEFVLEAIKLTGSYSAFSVDADPYELHEMGVIIVQEKTVWWKIDLYGRDYAYGSEAPTDPNQTRRVLTLLFPSEY